jgi:hypothetical protein
MESVAYGLWLHRMTGSAAEANRFGREYGVVHSPARASDEGPPVVDGRPSATGAAAQNGGAGASSDMLALVVTGSLISIIPLVLAFLMLQRYWQSGLATGGVKQ